MGVIYEDLETYSVTPIKHGLHQYSTTVEVMLWAYAIDEGPVQVWDLTEGSPMPEELFDAHRDPSMMHVAHNAAFERTVLASQGFPAEEWQWKCTMAQALQHGLPGGLEKLCAIFRLEADQAKDADGRRLVQLFCMPRPKNMKLRRATRQTHPEDWERFKEYCAADVVAMRVVEKRIPVWNMQPMERTLFNLDARINARGVQMDVELAQAAVAAIGREKVRLGDRTAELTEDELASTTKVVAFAKYLADQYDLVLPDMRSNTVERALSQEDLPQEVRELLLIRGQVSRTSAAKYQVVLNGTNADGRLRGTTQYCGAARTGRWAGRLFQPQNLPRPTLKQSVIEAGIRAIKMGVEDLVVEDVMELASSAVRGLIIAPPGKKLAVADLANIEGRVLAWLAGEDWKVAAFRAYDTIVGYDKKGKPLRAGPDLYRLAFSRSFNKPLDAVADDERQIGKVQELACLGPDTQVLTDRGWVALVDITIDHKVWDGVEWVRHEGVVPRGLRRTLHLRGLEVTPDHLVMVGGSWLPAQTVASCASTLSRALATASGNSPSPASSSDAPAGCDTSWFDVPAARRGTGSTFTTSSRGEALAATRAPSAAPGTGESGITATRTSALMRLIDGACSIACRLASTAARTLATLVTTTTAAEASACTAPGSPIARRSSRTSSGFPGGMTPGSSSIASTSTWATSLGTFASSRTGRTRAIGERSQPCSGESSSSRPVYDIAHAGPRNRFTVLTEAGPLIVHNCGYQGSVGAFASMAALYGMELPEDEVLKIVRAWRRANANIVRFWYAVQNAARSAILNKGQEFPVGRVVFDRQLAWLRCRLPSGRYLCYPSPVVDTDTDKLSYMGVDPYTKTFKRLKTYGGKFVEQICQATARDVLAWALPRVEAAGYEIVLTVHDEVITEAPDAPQYNAAALSALISAGEEWTDGLPLAAEGFEAKRYRK